MVTHVGLLGEFLEAEETYASLYHLRKDKTCHNKWLILLWVTSDSNNFWQRVVTNSFLNNMS